MSECKLCGAGDANVDLGVCDRCRDRGVDKVIAGNMRGRIAALEAEVERLRRVAEAAKAVEPYLLRASDDGECEHGFYWKECPNKDCEESHRRGTIARLQDALAALSTATAKPGDGD
jgi:hypothetical protein